MERTEESAGGVVLRRAERGLEVALAERVDRRTGLRAICLPKGLVDPGETPEAAAVREVAEETGLSARILEALPVVRYRYVHPADGARIAKRVRFYAMAFEGGEARPVDGEMERVFWCALDDAPSRLSYAGERATVRRVRARASALAPQLALRV